MCMIVAKCIHGFYSIMHDRCYTYMHALHYSYGRMQCINTPAPELRDVISAVCWQNVEGRRSDDVAVMASAEEKRREHVGSER
jgi:hypothetical protein